MAHDTASVALARSRFQVPNPSRGIKDSLCGSEGVRMVSGERGIWTAFSWAMARAASGSSAVKVFILLAVR